MSKAFEGQDMAFTARTETREGLAKALKTLQPEDFEVVLATTGDLRKTTIRTETVAGCMKAVDDIAPEWKHAIVRVFFPVRA
jgi:cation transport ATPase